jgi:hypothetical protein
MFTTGWIVVLLGVVAMRWADVAFGFDLAGQPPRFCLQRSTISDRLKKF